jgi:hypothetical protein
MSAEEADALRLSVEVLRAAAQEVNSNGNPGRFFPPS